MKISKITTVEMKISKITTVEKYKSKPLIKNLKHPDLCVWILLLFKSNSEFETIFDCISLIGLLFVLL